MQSDRPAKILLILCCFFVSAVSLEALNRTQQENTLPGTTAWQLTSPAAAREIEGYASLTSVNVGSTINLFVSTADPTYTINVYRVGWYGGTGGRLVFGPVTRTGGLQATPVADGYGMYECRWTNAYVLAHSAGLGERRLRGKANRFERPPELHPVRCPGGRPRFRLPLPIQRHHVPGLQQLARIRCLRSLALRLQQRRRRRRQGVVQPTPTPWTRIRSTLPRSVSSFFLRWEINMLRWLEMSGLRRGLLHQRRRSREPRATAHPQGLSDRRPR